MKVTVRISAAPAFDGGAAGVGAFAERIRRADEYGFHRISVGDTQLNNLECFTALGVAAQHSSRAMLGPGVTNPVTRDVGVMANTLASLDAVSGGRMFCLLARGDGAVHNAGLRPATVDQIGAYFQALKDLLNTGYATFGDRAVRLPWAGKHERKVPLYLVAEGPRMLRLAGRIADGVFVGAGLTQEVVDDALAKIASGAESAGRTIADLDIWWDTRSGVALTRDDAMHRARESLASVGNHVFRAGFEGKHAPPELHDRLREYARRFDYSEKGTSVQNGPLMDELGLTDYFERRFGVIGTPEQIVRRLRELEKLGVTQVSMASHDRGLKGVPDSVTLLGEAVLPHVR
ncbi:LLM class flavin-dependent oxidoreductase [Actinomadura syzygii]|uniref:LLM class flavin-dependent oxidoreductase n=1 Tax=Actinomadura syzygii TaxID=1427538 RepID=A0A5D0U639_9ACTN|nr:LLM class flavin-dependent oxidoreductase [Actinomadura syzygii]TYC13193.1 LLM class flavin-dependent oxidoreductase [Actinomadura syzygii]